MIYRFGSFELDLDKAELRADGTPQHVEPQVFALLAFLIENRERMVSRDEIFERLWERRVVTDSALSSRVKAARKVIGDDGRAQRFIKTIHGRGLRFVGDVRIERDDIAVSSSAAAEPATADTTTAAEPSTDSRPSIAVLPFRVIGDAGNYATIADGLPHELITELARLRWLFVIARGSSFKLGRDNVDACEAGRLLGARYCLSGTVEVTGQRLAITTELVDAVGGDVVWAERFSGSVDDVHAVREEIRQNILAALEIQIPLHEAAAARLRDAADLDAWSAYHLGLQHLYRFNSSDNALAARLFERALERDPGFARAHAGMSFVHFQTAFMHRTRDISGETAEARRFAQQGLDIDPLDPFVNFTMGRSYWLDADLDRAESWLERATSLCPNYAQGIYAQAWTRTMSGHSQSTRGDIDLAMRLSPLDPLYYAMLATRGFTHMLDGDFEHAAEWADRGARSPGAHVLIAMIAAVARELAGDPAGAQVWAENVRSRNPELRSADFFGSFPLQSKPLRSSVSAALGQLGF